MTFAVLVKNGRGNFLQAGSAKTAIRQARRILGCSKNEIHFFSTAKISGGLNFYFFDVRDADQAYWLEALKIESSEVLGSVQVPQVQK